MLPASTFTASVPLAPSPNAPLAEALAKVRRAFTGQPETSTLPACVRASRKAAVARGSRSRALPAFTEALSEAVLQATVPVESL